MLEISDGAFVALRGRAYSGFVDMLAGDLFNRYPERFSALTAEDMRRYVVARIDYAAHFDITREDCVAELADVECQCMADFPAKHADGWWKSVIEGDGPQEQRIACLSAQLSQIELHPAFRPELF